MKLRQIPLEIMIKLSHYWNTTSYCVTENEQGRALRSFLGKDCKDQTFEVNQLFSIWLFALFLLVC